MMGLFKTLSLYCLFALLISCGPKFTASSDSITGSLADFPNQDQQTPPNSGDLPPQDKTNCGALSFDGVQWPISLNLNDRSAIRLALNITGSFEGKNGWTNLSNNFDGQGFSLGLLQQNLGQGSLQPLLISMRNRFPTSLVQVYGQKSTDSLLNMIAEWESPAGVSSLQKFASDFQEEPTRDQELFSNSEGLSPLDIGFSQQINQGSDSASFFAFKNSASNSKNGRSVDWALAMVFSDDGVTFKSDWKTALQKMAGLPEYRSLQIEASLNIYRKAIQYFSYFKFHELRSVLLMYDFVVQNGGFNTTHQAQYADFEKQNPQASETQKLKALLEIRLLSVNSQYVSDVRSRKTAIIDGGGKVHGTTRNLTKEYCYQGSENFQIKPVL